MPLLPFQYYSQSRSAPPSYPLLYEWAPLQQSVKESLGPRASSHASYFLFLCDHQILTTHHARSSVLAWRIPGMGDPGGLPSMGSHRVGHDWSDLAAAACPRGATSLLTCLHSLAQKRNSVRRCKVTEGGSLPVSGNETGLLFLPGRVGIS